MSIMNPFCLKLIQIIFLMCLVLQAHQLVCSNEVVRCIQSERQALLQFKAGLIDEFGMLSSWTTKDCCQWYGIGCSTLTGHVSMLDLHGDYNYNYDYAYDYDYDGNKFYIGDDIHKSLMELQELQYLDLSGNNFQFIEIPDFFGSFRNLRHLDISYCNFRGEIPIQFESLYHLKYLNLSNNGLYGVIPHRFGDLSNLQFLDLSYNDLQGSIPSQLGNLSKLQYLDLLGNLFEGKIPSQLGKLTNLQKLYLGTYGVSTVLTIDNGDHNGGQWLSNLTSLTHLEMFSIYNPDKFNSWFQMVAKLPKLRELSLRNCSLSDHFIHSLSQSKFNFFTSLSILDLSENNFASSLIIIKSFMNVCTLSSLDLSSNSFIEDLQSIVNNLSSCCVRNPLQVLDLSCNGITGTLPDLSAFTSLKTLDLSFNKLSGKIHEGSSLPFQLEQLFIRSNSLEGGIPKSFWMNACKLKSLVLSNNSLRGELQLIIHQLSRFARHSLQQLDLSSNQINGTLSDLSIFSFLEIFDISKNRLNRTIFEDIL